MFFTYFFLTLLLIVFLLFSFLWIPIKYNFKLQYENNLNLDFSINWFFLHITYKLQPHPLLQIGLGNRKLYPSKPIKKTSPDPYKGQTKKTRNIFKFKRSDWQKYLKIIVNLIIELLNHIKPQKFKLYSTIGLSEPHQTAFVFATVSPLQRLLNLDDIYLQPLWNEEYIDLDIHIIGKLTPAIIFLIFIKFIFKQEIRVLWVNSIKNSLRLKTVGIY